MTRIFFVLSYCIIHYFWEHHSCTMAKINYYIASGLGICFALMLCNCSKTKHRDYVELDTDSAIIKHFNFLPGTYWIYKDEYNGRIDSFYVRSNYYTTQTESQTDYRYHFVIIAEVNGDGSNPADSANWVFDYEGVQVMMEYDYTTYVYGWKNQIQFKPLYRFPFLYGDQLSKYDTAAITQVDSFILINGLSFYQVAHVYHQADPAPASINNYITKLQDMFYINDSVGMVEITLNHPNHGISHDWRLLRYKIVR
jgi:hypothetical protein